MNIVRPRQNGRHFTDNTFQLTFYMKKVVFWFKFHWNLFKKVWLIKSQHWFGRWHQTGDKPLIEKIMVYFSDTYRGLVQDCSNSSASAMELLQSCAKPSIYASQGCDELNDIILLCWTRSEIDTSVFEFFETVNSINFLIKKVLPSVYIVLWHVQQSIIA